MYQKLFCKSNHNLQQDRSNGEDMPYNKIVEKTYAYPN